MKLVLNFFTCLMFGLLVVFVPHEANAEPVVTAIYGEPQNAVRPNYLTDGGDDDGYIAITARVTLPAGLSCVTPTNLKRYDNFFVKNNLEIVLFATVEGFQAVDPKQPIPITAYKFDDATGKYCTAPFALPVILVPNHRFGRRGPTGAPQPKITITMVYTAKGEELVTPIVTSWINVAAAVSTGGAAQTVVGISNIASSKAIGAIAGLYNARSQNRAEQKFTIDLPWSTLIKGPASSTISFYESSTNFGESVENAIARIRKNPKADKIKAVFDLSLAYEFRRSLFIEDNDFDATTKQPKIDARLSSANVLNFPAKDAVVSVIFPNLTQILGSSAPSITQAIAAGDASKCDAMFVTLRSLGLNGFDRAIVADAILDGNSKLRSDTPFLSDCFDTEKEAFTTLVKAYGKTRYPTSPVMTNHSLVPISGSNVAIDMTMQDRLSEIRSALTVKLGADAKANTLKSALGSSTSIAWGGDFSTSAAPLDTQVGTLATLNVSSASCLYRLATDPGPPNEYRAFMIAKLSASGETTPTPYLIVVDFDTAKPYAVRGLQMRSVANDTKADTHFNYLKGFMYDDRSACAKVLA